MNTLLSGNYSGNCSFCIQSMVDSAFLSYASLLWRLKVRCSLGRAYKLELAFDTRSLRNICESESNAKREFGEKVAESLRHRLADLHAAGCPRDLLAGHPRVLDGDHRSMAVDLCDGYSLVFSANHSKNPMTEAGSLDWERVSRVKIMRLERNHA